MLAELHAHSGYSFLDGTSSPEELVGRARELGYPALALTDHDGLYGSMEFARAAKAAGIQPVTGVELTVRDCGLPGEEIGADGAPSTFHLTLLAETPTGYANLCRVITESHRIGPRGAPALPLDLLLARAEGLILLSGCRRSPLAHALEDGTVTGEAFARRLLDAFGPENLFVELQQNRVRGDAPRNRTLGRLADRLGIPVVGTGNAHYHDPGLHRLQDVLVAIRHRSTLDASHRERRPNACFHLASPKEMAARFQSREDALRNTLRIAERCSAFDLTNPDHLGYTFPDFDGSERGSAMRILSEITWAALEDRYPGGPAAGERERRVDAEKRLRKELALVERHGLGGFFLVYRDIMELARDIAARVRGASPRGSAGLPPGRGRGSSVSSIICYLIGLSHVDPVDAKLFLGRFLEDVMGSVPDIDLDFPRDIREELILEVYRKYGHDHTGLVAIFPTYRLRSAVREVGRALELPPGDLEKIVKLAERHSARGLREDLERIPEFAAKLDTPPWRHFLERVDEIGGLPRHISQHVGGMIISSRPLIEIVPIEPAAMEGRFVCQWDKDSCDDARFIKIDFLALGMLSLVEEAVDLIAERHGAAPDLSRIDMKDEAVFDRICAGDTVGVFQIESRAQIQMIRRTRPRTLEELAIQVAIVRPGPIVGGAVNPYVRRREALRANPDYEIPYEHPLLRNALEDTLGVILYQDQVLQVCRDLAGFTDGQAEQLRRAMSRKRSDDAMRAHEDAFLAGALEQGVQPDTAREIFRQVIAFAEFGFPKSHAAAFGLLAYQSAWLRHYHPVEFTVALFNNQPMGFFSLDVLGWDARRHGIEVLPPDLNRSGVRCTVEEVTEEEMEDVKRMEGGGTDPGPHPPLLLALRVGLGFIRGWGEAIAERVVQERERGGNYRSLVDFLRRTPAALRRPAIENLIWVGGLDEFGLTRRELLWQAGLRLGPDEERSRAEGRADDPRIPIEFEDPDAGHAFAPLDPGDRVLADYRMLRFSTGVHPMALMRKGLPAGVLSSSALPEAPDRGGVAVAGVVVARQRPQTASGYIFILIEDEFGHINVIVKPEIHDRYRAAVRMEPLLLVRGKLRKDGATINVVATSIEALRGAAASMPAPAGSAPEHPEHEDPRQRRDFFSFLTALRETPPDAKSWG